MTRSIRTRRPRLLQNMKTWLLFRLICSLPSQRTQTHGWCAKLRMVAAPNLRSYGHWGLGSRAECPYSTTAARGYLWRRWKHFQSLVPTDRGEVLIDAVSALTLLQDEFIVTNLLLVLKSARMASKPSKSPMRLTESARRSFPRKCAPILVESVQFEWVRGSL